MSFLILIIGFSAYAQNQDGMPNKMSIMKPEKPILIINENTIGSIDLLNKIPSENILELNVFKERKLSSTYLFIENEKSAGIIIAKSKHEFKIKSQKEKKMILMLTDI
jgi:hypothetical protein